MNETVTISIDDYNAMLLKSFKFDTIMLTVEKGYTKNIEILINLLAEE